MEESEGCQGRRCKRVAAEIDGYRLEMGQRQWKTVAESEGG